MCNLNYFTFLNKFILIMSHRKWTRTAKENKRIFWNTTKFIKTATSIDSIGDFINSKDKISFLKNGSAVKFNDAIYVNNNVITNKTYDISNYLFKQKENDGDFKIKEKIKNLVIINFYHNFLHILLDSLPSIIQILNELKEFNIIILNEGVGILCMIKQIFGDMYPFYKTHLLDKKECYHGENIYVIQNYPKQHGEYIRYCPSYLKLFKNVVNTFHFNLKKSKINLKKYKRIYVSRRFIEESKNKGIENIDKTKKAYRCIENHLKFKEVLEDSYGFREIHMEKYTMLEKIYILQNAEYIIIDGGASCAINSFIKNKKVLVLLCPLYFYWCYPHEISVKYNKNKITPVNISISRGENKKIADEKKNELKTIMKKDKIYEYDIEYFKKYIKEHWNL